MRQTRVPVPCHIICIIRSIGRTIEAKDQIVLRMSAATVLAYFCIH